MSSRDFKCLNWNFRVEKLAKRLESWKFRNLSLKGKSMIIWDGPLFFIGGGGGGGVTCWVKTIVGKL